MAGRGAIDSGSELMAGRMAGKSGVVGRSWMTGRS